MTSVPKRSHSKQKSLKQSVNASRNWSVNYVVKMPPWLKLLPSWPPNPVFTASCAKRVNSIAVDARRHHAIKVRPVVIVPMNPMFAGVRMYAKQDSLGITPSHSRPRVYPMIMCIQNRYSVPANIIHGFQPMALTRLMMIQSPF